MTSTLTSLLAIFGGILLGFMVYFNGIVAKYIGATSGSVIVHIIGLITVVLIYFIMPKTKTSVGYHYSFNWTHIVGVFGCLAVVIIGYCVNTKLGVAGTVGSIVCGQIFYGWANDIFGLFGSEVRKISVIDIIQATFILLGVGVLIYG